MAHDILIVDDETDIRVLTSGILEDEGYESREAADSASALAVVESRRPSLVLLDIWLQGSELDGLGILGVQCADRRVRRRYRSGRERPHQPDQPLGLGTPGHRS